MSDDIPDQHVAHMMQSFIEWNELFTEICEDLKAILQAEEELIGVSLPAVREDSFNLLELVSFTVESIVVLVAIQIALNDTTSRSKAGTVLYRQFVSSLFSS